MINRVNVIITHRCNLFCKHCYMNANNNHDEDQEIILNRFKSIIPLLKENNINEVMITGGECTVSENFKPIIELCNKENIKVGIFTNGILLRKEELKYIDNYCLSLDGKKEYHNYLRGSNKAYDKLLSNLKILKENKKDITIQMTVSKDNIDDIIPTTELINSLKINKLNLCCLLDEGRCLENSIDTSVDFNKLKKIIYKSLSKTGYNVRIHTNIFNKYSINNYLLNDSIMYPLWIDLVNNSYYLIKENSLFSNNLENFSKKNIEMLYNKINKFIQNNQEKLSIKSEFILENEIIKLLYESEGGINE